MSFTQIIAAIIAALAQLGPALPNLEAAATQLYNQISTLAQEIISEFESTGTVSDDSVAKFKALQEKLAVYKPA